MSIPHQAFLAMLAEKQQILRDNHLIDITETMRTDIQEASCGNMKIDEPLKGKGYPYNEKTFKPHMMYDLKTGKSYKAETYQDHLDMKEKGYGHDKPKVKEDTEQVDELKVKTLRSYISKAQKDNTQRVIRMTDKPSHMKADKGEMDKLRKRQKGVANAKTDIAMRRIAGKDYRKRMGEGIELEEATNTSVVVDLNDAATSPRSAHRRLELKISSLDGYRESEFDSAKNMATFRFDAKKHDVSERKQVVEFIKKTKGAEFHHSMTEETELEEGPATQNPLKTAFGGMKAAKDTPSYRAYMKRVGKEQKDRAKKIAAERKSGKRSKYESVDNPEYEPELGEMNIGEEQIEEMSAKAHYKSVLKGGKGKGYVVGVAIDRERYPNREKQGLEGPYKSRKSGKIFYYDKKEGKYYDPDSDMYLKVSDVMERYESADLARERDEKELKEDVDMINEDDVERREIELFTSNHAQIYRQRIQPIIKNLAKKKAKGNYDDKLAIKAWTYAVNDGIKAYNKEFGSSIKLSKAEKDKAAEYLLKHFEDE